MGATLITPPTFLDGKWTDYPLKVYVGATQVPADTVECQYFLIGKLCVVRQYFRMTTALGPGRIYSELPFNIGGGAVENGIGSFHYLRPGLVNTAGTVVAVASGTSKNVAFMQDSGTDVLGVAGAKTITNGCLVDDSCRWTATYRIA